MYFIFDVSIYELTFTLIRKIYLCIVMETEVNQVHIVWFIFIQLCFFLSLSLLSQPNFTCFFK